MLKYVLSLALFSLIMAPKTQARENEGWKRENQEMNMRWDMRQKIRLYSPNCRAEDNHKPQPVLTRVNCGDTITSSITIANDLNCPGFTGFALKVVGNDIVINGNGKKINATSAAAGVFANGKNISISKTIINGISQGYGILAYEAPGIRISSTDLSQNLIGVMVYADSQQISSVKISNNKIRSSSAFAIRTYSDEPGAIVSPSITGNDLQNSGDYALYVKASQFNMGGDDNNNYANSVNGVYLKGGTFKVADLAFKNQPIQKRHFFVDSANFVSFYRVDVSSLATDNGMQERVGIDLYRALKFEIKEVTAINNDVGVILETEQGVSPEGYISKCQFIKNTFAGIDIVSYDSTRYGTVKTCRNKFSLATNAFEVFVHSGTIVDIQNACQVSDSKDDRDDRDHDRDHDDRDGDDRGDRDGGSCGEDRATKTYYEGRSSRW